MILPHCSPGVIMGPSRRGDDPSPVCFKSDCAKNEAKARCPESHRRREKPRLAAPSPTAPMPAQVSSTALHKLSPEEISPWAQGAQPELDSRKDFPGVQGCWIVERVQEELRNWGNLKMGRKGA